MAVRAFLRPTTRSLSVRLPRALVTPSTACQIRARNLQTPPQAPRESAWIQEGGKVIGKRRDGIFRTEFFPDRHIGPDGDETQAMLKVLDPPANDLQSFIDQTIPADIRTGKMLSIDYTDEKGRHEVDPRGLSEPNIKRVMKEYSSENARARSYIGCGYYDTVVPEVIERNVLKSPAWYTSYTPYQAEISQGRLESLLNFQTVVTDLTGLSIANASVLDEATAAAEAMTMSLGSMPASKQKKPHKKFVVSSNCHPQTLAVLQSRADGFGIEIVVGDLLADDCKLIRDQGQDLIGALAQYPDTRGGVFDYQPVADAVHSAGALFSVATDLLALTVLKPPGEFGADIALGSAQRLGVPLGFGGPHAAFFACDDKHKRKIPGRLIGVSKDRLGNNAMRLALQTREQHIRREKATSNICTAQALLANMSSLYAVYHGPHGLTRIAQNIRHQTRIIQDLLMSHGFKITTSGTRDDGAVLFDTFVVSGEASQMSNVKTNCSKPNSIINLNWLGPNEAGISIDENLDFEQATRLLEVFGVDFDAAEKAFYGTSGENIQTADADIPQPLRRTSRFMEHPVFNRYHSETELLRYIYHLQSKDLSLVHSMIPLGSCTMKLNAATEMLPVTMDGFANVHPFAPSAQNPGYLRMIKGLSDNLCEITGMAAVSLQPNSGAQGEFAGLRVIKKYQESLKDGHKRDICLIPVSAHGTNPASAAMAGMRVIPLKCDTKTGNLDLEDLQQKCQKHKDELAAIMITYPSTFGVFEPEVKKVCEIVHQHGGQVYMDGANMNAQIGLCNPGDIGADVCHLNLHKTFCIPHGGGGPGVGPIAVKEHLALHLPTHPKLDPHRTRSRQEERAEKAIAPVSAAPFGSASILTISYAYIQMMGALGLTHQTKIALLNANYIMSRLKPHYPILYTNDNGRCAHEFILDARGFKATSGIEAIDIAKRLQDYGFHAPTMSWPVANTLMIEPTESESKAELDRFCDALIQIRKEIKEIEDGDMPKEGNVLRMAPHPQHDLLTDNWDRPYTREKAAYPLPWLKEKKFWPFVARVDDTFGDTNLFCTCAPVENYDEDLKGMAAPAPT